MRRIKRALYTVSAAVFPVHCPFCGGVLPPHILYCQECAQRMSMISQYDIPDGLTGLAVCYEYDGEARDAVLRFKSGGEKHAAVAFSAMMTECCEEFIDRVDVVTGVPSSFEKRLERGYVPAFELAKGVALYADKPYKRMVALTGSKKEQKSLDRQHRIENAGKGLKIVNESYICGKNILVVDDVCTTGSTMSAVSMLLKENGANEIYGVTFAKSLLKW